jgi:hypothetical protein
MQLQVISTDEGHRLRGIDGDGAAGHVELVKQDLDTALVADQCGSR